MQCYEASFKVRNQLSNRLYKDQHCLYETLQWRDRGSRVRVETSCMLFVCSDKYTQPFSTKISLSQ